MMDTGIFRSLLRSTGIGLLLGLAVACRSAPPAPPPPVEAPPAAAETPPAPERTVRVTTSRLNVREKPTTEARTVGRLRKGDRLAVLGADGVGLEVRLQDGSTGWIHGSYATDENPCPADRADPQLLSEVPLSFHDGAPIGTVVVEAGVDAAGNVASTRVVRDTTGIPELVQRTETEVKAFKFAPPVRNCRPVPFVYTYTRDF